MMAAKLSAEGGKVCLMLVLEPGNIEKLAKGEPIQKWLNEFLPELTRPIEILLMYSPDIVWVAQKMRAEGVTDAVRMAEIIDESLSRPPVVVRDMTAEEMKKVM
jgi:hypothetical protein